MAAEATNAIIDADPGAEDEGGALRRHGGEVGEFIARSSVRSLI